MSRIGKKIIEIPAGVAVTFSDGKVVAKGKKGQLEFKVPAGIETKIEDQTISFSLGEKRSRSSQALWGTTRARVFNMIKGVSEGFSKELELQGVGYRAQLKGKDLEVVVGYSHPVLVKGREGISFTVADNIVKVEGFDKVEVGQVAADIRAIRKPEPYKGKGIRYRGEKVRRKVGKVVGVA